jgi:hypothetical protein
MALAPCPECGEMISMNAGACPSCGCDFKHLALRQAQQRGEIPTSGDFGEMLWFAVKLTIAATIGAIILFRILGQ